MTAHQSVLLQESVEGLAIKQDGIYVDGTFGRGGHSRAILQHLGPSGRLIAIDKDLDAISHAEETFSQDDRFTIVQGSFANIQQYMNALNLHGKVDGILLDLGMSSPQLDNSERGFSFMHQGPLDMRMDVGQKLSAAGFINKAPAEELATVFREYGEERFSGRIARAIVAARETTPIETTNALAEIVKQANPKWEKHKHPATRVFQALRIHVNQELDDLTEFLKHSLSVLAIGGRLSIISFHSLEDRIVKQFMRDQEQGPKLPPGVPVKAAEMKTSFKRIGKAIKPQEHEIKQNVRARSAVLRIGEKIA
jgi:16S rRNA (cytosine1402-N4)-methyltransferase